MNKLANLSRSLVTQQVKGMYNMSEKALDARHLLTSPRHTAPFVWRTYSVEVENISWGYFTNGSRGLCTRYDSSQDREKSGDLKLTNKENPPTAWGDVGELGDNYYSGNIEASDDTDTLRDPFASKVNICNLPGVQNVNYV